MAVLVKTKKVPCGIQLHGWTALWVRHDLGLESMVLNEIMGELYQYAGCLISNNISEMFFINRKRGVT